MRALPSRLKTGATGCLLALTLLLAAPGARAQAAFQPEFDVDAVSVRADGAGANTRVDLYTRVPYQSLRFLNQAGGFTARYTVSVEIFRADEQGRAQNLVGSRNWERTVQVPTYAATQSDTLADFVTQSLELAPGNYALEIQLEDGASRRSAVRKLPLMVRRFDQSLAMSDLLVLDRYDRARQTIQPNVSNSVGSNQREFTLFYEIYAAAPQTVRVVYEIGEQNRQRQRPSARSLFGFRRDQREDEDAPAVTRTETLSVRAGRNPAALTLSTEPFRASDYVARVRLETTDGRLLAEAEKPIAFRWMGLTDQIQDLDAAISQLRFIAKDREIRAMQQAPTYEERLRLFNEFWSRRDPTPGTRRNERMEEYYYRVNLANKNYGRFREGWNTDRGEVFIRFGEPDFVERHPFGIGNSRPYQVWYYNRLGRRFIFVDRTGFDDYELLVPIWDERTRM